MSKVVFSSQTVDKLSSSDILLNFLLPDTTMWYIWFLILESMGTLFFSKLGISDCTWTVIGSLFFIFAIFLGGPLNARSLPLGLQHLSSLPIYYGLGLYTAKTMKRIGGKSRCSSKWFISSLIMVALYCHYLGCLTEYPTTFLPVHSFLRYMNGFAMTYIIFHVILMLEILFTKCFVVDW